MKCNFRLQIKAEYHHTSTGYVNTAGFVLFFYDKLTNTVSSLKPISSCVSSTLFSQNLFFSYFLCTEHVFAFKDILLISQTFRLDKKTSESKQQAVIPANNSRYCGKISLTKFTFHHCFKISLNTV